MRYLPRGGAGVRGVVVLAVIVVGAISRGMSHSDINSEIRKASAEVNAKCPEQLTPEVRMDSTTPGDHRITYNYTLTIKDVSAEELKESAALLKSSIMADVRKEKDTKTLLDLGVTLGYHFSDPSGKLLCEFDVAPNR